MAALVEEVYRVGGRYDASIRAIVAHLATRRRSRPPALRAALEALIRFYETGDDRDREAFDIAWVQNHDSPVDTMNGFIEVYMDARGVRARGKASCITATRRRPRRSGPSPPTRSGSRITCRSTPRYRKPVVQGVSAMAIEVVIETGDSGPVTPIGVNLPNDQRIREEYGSKSVSLANVLDAYEKSTARELPPRVRVGRGRSGTRARMGGVRRRTDDRDP